MRGNSFLLGCDPRNHSTSLKFALVLRQSFKIENILHIAGATDDLYAHQNPQL